VAEPGQDAAGYPIEVVPVVVLSQVFTARPSSIPDIRDFVRRCLAESPLTDEGNREVGDTVFRALLKAAGPTGSIQVAFRIFPDHVEVDVLHSDTVIQPPTVPGPPVSTVIPAQVSTTDSGHGWDGPHLAHAIREGGLGMPNGGAPLRPGDPHGPVPAAPATGSPFPASPFSGSPVLVGSAPAGSVLAGPGGPVTAGSAAGESAAGDPGHGGGPAGSRPDGRVPGYPGAGTAGGPAVAGAGTPETFAEWMSSALRREGLTQEAAARQLGVSVKTVSRWVGGATEPRMRDLRRIQELFGEVPIP
jgi:hypothetical protein